MLCSTEAAALAAAKARGKVLGGNRGAVLSEKARATGRAIQIKRAGERAADLGPMIRSLQQAGIDTLCAIARALSERGVPTARGGPRWTATQVARVLERQQ